MASTTRGLELGVTQDEETETTWLVTGLDLDRLPVTLPIRPYRLVDTRSEEGREGIRSSSPTAAPRLHVVVDLTGVSLFGISGNTRTTTGSASQRKAARANRMTPFFEPNQKR